MIKSILKKNKKIIFYFSFIILLVTLLSFGLDFSVKAEETTEFSLEKAIEVAYENNTELKQAERTKEKSELDLSLAWRSLFPELKLESSYTRMGEAPKQPIEYGLYQTGNNELEEGPDGNKIPVDTYLMFPTDQKELSKDNYQTSLSFTQPIYMGGQIRLGIKQAEKGLEMAELQNKQKKSEILIKIINSYYNLLMAKERVDIEESALSLVEEHKNIAQSSYESGVALKTDVLQAEIELAKAENSLKNAKNQFNLAKKSFKNQIGLDKDKVIRVSEPNVSPELNLKEKELYEKAVAENTDLQLIELNKKITETNLKMEERSKFPQIMLIGNYKWQGEELNFEDGSGNIVLSASMSLFDGGKSSIKEEKIEKDIKNIEENKKNIKDMLSLDIEQQLTKINEHKDNIKLQNMNLEKAEESLEIEEKRFKEGMAKSVDVLQAHTTLKQIKMTKMQAENQYEIALFEMLNKTGQLVEYCEEVINNEK